ncbi:Rieske (2Fe-2S) protein [Niveispirillum sp. KHB5.9]|uniref:Rieske (2Fe-2S) protein n=1 Tax=Niveispirillum sp. KHB5.9 TaxID=3400269 RepID=UPI003A88828B
MVTAFDVCALSDLVDGDKRLVHAGGEDILLCRTGVDIRAVRNMCTHAASGLEEGRLRGGVLVCPLHGARFDLNEGGRCLGGAGYRPLMMFETKVEGGRVWVVVEV